MSDFQFLVPSSDKENVLNPIENGNKTYPSASQCSNTPTDSKVSHPVFKNLVIKRSNSMINDSFFSETDGTPSHMNFLSPDLAGGLFPKDINTSEVDMQKTDNFCKKFRSHCHNYSSISSQDSILPSPGITDSSPVTHKSEIFNMSRSLSVPVTPPSNYKWNRKEYRSNELEDSPLTDDESNDEYIPERNHFESTQIFDNGISLADNVSMRRLSTIKLKTNNSSNNDSANFSRVSYKGKPLKSFINSEKYDSSGIGSIGMSRLSCDNTNSNANNKSNRYAPYYKSSPCTTSNRKIHFNLNINSPISPIIKPSSEICQNMSINNDSSLILQLNNSIDFSNSIIEIDSPIIDNSKQQLLFQRFDLNGSNIPKLIDLDISPINSDDDD